MAVLITGVTLSSAFFPTPPTSGVDVYNASFYGNQATVVYAGTDKKLKVARKDLLDQDGQIGTIA